MAIVRGHSENDIELGAEFSGFGIRNGGEFDHEELGGLAQAADESVLLVSFVTSDEALSGEGAFVTSIDRDVNMRSARTVWYGLDGTKVISPVAGRHETSKSLEVVIAFGAGQSPVLAVNVGSLVIHLPNFHAGIGNGIAFNIGDLAVEMSDRPDSRSGGIVDAEKVVVGVEREFIRIERSLGHGRSGDESLGQGTGCGEERCRTKSGPAEEITTMAFGAIEDVHWMILRE